MAIVNAELYDFLKEHETGLYRNSTRKGDTIIVAYVFVDFDDCKEFTDILGANSFDEGGLDCKLQDGNICIEINNIIEYEGHKLSDYKKCFNEDDWNNYKEEIEEMENKNEIIKNK